MTAIIGSSLTATAATAAPLSLNSAVAAAMLAPPAAVTGVSVVQAEGFATVIWSPAAADPGGPAITYQIGRQPVDAQDQPTGEQIIAGLWRSDRNVAGVTTFADSGFVIGARYAWQVRALSGTEAGPWSAPVYGTTTGAGGPQEYQTGFEKTGGAAWTTEAEELALLAALDAGSSRVAVKKIATTAQGRAMNLAIVTNKPDATPAEIAALNPSLIACTVHGNEPAGREACLLLARELAFSTDPAVVDLLTKSAVLLVPTVNPDGRANNTRGNTTGQDLNRDHSLLTQPETFGFAQVLRDYQPISLVDGHEYGNNNTGDLPVLWPRNPNVDSALHDSVQQDLVLGHIFDQADVSGWWPVPYPIGYAQETILRNTTGLKNISGMLLESRVTAGPTRPGGGAQSSAANMQRRVYSQLWTFQELVAYHQKSFAKLVDLTDSAAKRQTASTAPIALDGSRDVPGSLPPAEPSTKVLDPAPCGYRLTPADLPVVDGGTTVAEKLAAHGIVVSPRSKDAVVLLAQPLRGLIPLLLDPDAVAPMVKGERLLADCLAKTTTTVTVAPARTSSGRADVAVTVSVKAADGETATGSVDLTVAGVDAGSADLVDGAATVVIPAAATAGFGHGTKEILASYAPEGLFTGSTGTGLVAINFKDVPTSNGFFNHILWLIDSGISRGNSDGTFRSVDSVDRGSMAAFVYRAKTGQATAPACTVRPFTDVKLGYQFCGEIAWMKANGLTTGFQEGTYQPDAKIERQAMAAFLYRLGTGNAPNPECDTTLFKDVKKGDPFCGEITWAASNSITFGDKGNFIPLDPTSRQATAAFLYRFAQLG
ncbi:carboxypeptidase [Nakamurella silvestris]|nr:carboxypeptidase [Nakamurella silvestris]